MFELYIERHTLCAKSEIPERLSDFIARTITNRICEK